MKNCIVYGGTFDPMGLHHLRAIEWLLGEHPQSTVLVAPSYRHPTKDQRSISPFEDRILVARHSVRSLGSDDRVFVSDIERDLTTGSHLLTYDLMRGLQEKAPGLQFKFAVGADLDLSRWEKGEELRREFEIVTIPLIEGADGAVHATTIREYLRTQNPAWLNHVAPTAHGAIWELMNRGAL